MNETIGDPSLNKWSEAELLEAARRDLGEDGPRLGEDLAALRTWISKSPHLHSIRQDDGFLTAFLRGCKFSLERTKEKLDFHFTVKTSLPVWFDNWDPRLPEMRTIIEAGLVTPLPGYDQHGRRVVVMRMGRQDPDTMKKEDLFKAVMMMMTAALDGDMQALILGVVIVSDLQGMTLAKTVGMTPTLLKRAVTVQDGYPTRPKAIHLINFPSVMESVYKMASSFQKEKMRRRHHIHPEGDYSQLQAELGVEGLPPEYGGTSCSLAELSQHWASQMEARRPWLMQQPKYKTDEAKRPGKPKSHSDIFGIEGSFRKLEID